MNLNIHCNDCPVSALCIAHNLSTEEKEKLNAIMTRVHFMRSGEHLYLQDQKMQHIYAVYSGCCKEYIVDEDGNEKITGFYYPGDLLALESLSSEKYHFSVVALEASQFCAIPVDALFKLMGESPTLLREFIYQMSNKLQKARNITVATDAKRRIAAFLLDIFYRSHEEKAGSDFVHLSMSQYDISNLLGLAHETVSRTLHTFQYEHIIKIMKKDIYITDIDSLRTIAHVEFSHFSRDY